MKKLLNSIFINKNFTLLWTGSFVSLIGAEAYILAEALIVKHLTESGLMVGLLMALAYLPKALFAPIGGAFADQFCKKRILVITDVLSGLLLSLMAALWIYWDSDNIRLYLILGCSFLLSIFQAFFKPASMSLIPDIVPEKDLENANSIMIGVQNVVSVLGRALGGILYVALGPLKLIVVNAVSFLISGGFESLMSVKKLDDAGAPRKPLRQILFGTLQSVVLGFKFILASKPLLFFTIFIGLINFFLMPLYVILPFYIEDTLNLPMYWYSYVLVSCSVGGIAATMTASFFKRTIKRDFYLKGVTLCLSALFGSLIVFQSNKYSVLVGLFFTNYFLFTYNILVISSLQRKIRADVRGRVFGFITFLNFGLIPVAKLLSGFLIDLLKNNSLLILLYSLGYLMFSVAILASKNYRKFLEEKF